MSIRVALHHKTVYQYDRAVTLSPQSVRLRPAPHSRTPISSYSLRIEPANHFINWQQDPQGNFVARLAFPVETTVFSIEVDLVAEMTVLNPFDFFLEPHAEQCPFVYDEAQRRELAPYLVTTPAGPHLQAWLASIAPTGGRTIDFLVALNQRLQREIGYLIRLEPGVQTSEDTLSRASGSCRDSAWLLVDVFRHLGLAARFVSGYLIQLQPDLTPLDGPPGPTTDFTDLHAWAEVYLPGAGWIGLDPTSGLFAGEGHIPLAATPSPDSAAPVSGLVGPSQVEFHHEMSVTRIHEDPRVTKPYSDAQWLDVLALGDRVDRELTDGDVRLTMGGEPTFVSIDDMDGDEWNTAAMGPDKRRLAATLLSRVREAFAPGGLLHFGQGKWYPGESLPRWAFACYWRTDGAPLWHDMALVADPDRDYGYGTREAQAFADALADRLTVGRAHVIAAYEDPLAYIHKEQQLPVSVDPEHNTLDDPEERERLRRVFSRGLGTPSGFVLPLARVRGKSGPEWQSGLWMLRARHLFLVPGDSPVGFRLPLESLPEGAAFDVFPVDPLSAWPPLGSRPAETAGTRVLSSPVRTARARATTGQRRVMADSASTAKDAARRQEQHEQPSPSAAPLGTTGKAADGNGDWSAAGDGDGDGPHIRSPRGKAVGVPAAGRVGERLRRSADGR
jgi:transglutaminase-like putative cysteine protease